MIAQPGRFLLLFMLLALSACGSSPSAPESSTRSPGAKAAAVALDQVGVRYRYGGSGPQGFDCSGLVHYAYAQAGVAVPRTTGQLWAAAVDVDRADLRAGDLLFFSIEGKMSHVGMYLGERRFVHAPQSGRTVSVASMDEPFYRNALLRAGRIY
jgi:cell wall-associated NlpC family hydrolase